MTKIINLTPHTLHFLNEKNELILAVPPSEIAARCAVQRQKAGEVTSFTGNAIPVNRTVFGAVEGLPEPQEDSVYVVSAIVAQAVPDRQDVFIVDDAVRDEQGRIIGARALAHI